MRILHFSWFVILPFILNFGQLVEKLAAVAIAVGSFVGMTVLFYEKFLVLFKIDNLFRKH